jgi:hypothetical protein
LPDRSYDAKETIDKDGEAREKDKRKQFHVARNGCLLHTQM